MIRTLRQREYLRCIRLSVIRFVGYPTNYGTLFGMRNEDVSDFDGLQCAAQDHILSIACLCEHVKMMPQCVVFVCLHITVRCWGLPH